MFVYSVPLLVILLMTSQYIIAYPSILSKGIKYNHPINLRLKRDLGYLQHHELANNYNDDIPANFNENLPYIYSIIQRQNHKRLIDF
ncbi:unnamed protein product [Rotaria sp. Silwood2]|nr:unnamed protein product [Rotaria sp. Silwood2]CAF2692633.1 unnamed protein product [Rotaria sp. Silwood2]CAF2937847.1 unnamed protein product [Rotaria sp. Silwood2]CAF3087646.1 unnamed protein product [Rotaria sp. Silwood2]CAF4006591.1 unnamed protein product [Rotaria sp. Silwood2]